MTLSVNALTTVPYMQERLGLTDAEIASNLPLIERLIEASSGALERATGRNLASRTYTSEALDGTGLSRLQVPVKFIPITAITTLTLYDASLTTSQAITVSGASNELRWTKAGRLTLFPDATWSTFPFGFHNVLITFTSGLGEAVGDQEDQAHYDVAREACEQIIVGKWNSRQHDPSVKSMRVDDVSITYTDMADVQDQVAELTGLRAYSIFG